MNLKVYKTIINKKPIVVTAYSEYDTKEALCKKFDRKRVSLEQWGVAYLSNVGYDYVSIEEQPNLKHYGFK